MNTDRAARESRTGDECEVILDVEPLVEEGDYVVTYEKHYTALMSGKGKLIIEFVISEGDSHGLVLKAYFPVTLAGPPGPSGRFRAQSNGKYFEQICNVIPDLATGRLDRLSPRYLRGMRIRVKVTTVTTNWDGSPRKPHTQYSKIERLLGKANSHASVDENFDVPF